MRVRSAVLATVVGAAGGCSLFIDTSGYDEDPPAPDAAGTADTSTANDASAGDTGALGDGAPTDDAAGDAATKDVALVADWPFDEGAGTSVLDKSGHGHNGVIFGGTWGPDQSANTGSALAFDGGAASYVVISGAPDFDRPAAPAFAMMAWARFDEVPAHDMFFSVNFGTQDSAFGIELIDATTLTYWDDSAHVAQAAVPSVVGQWHHFAVVVDGSEARVFFDGVRLNKGTAKTTPRTSTQIFFGRSSFGNTMMGAVDKARFFRSALTDDEVMAERNR